MKLYYTGNSPYARRARLAVLESGLASQVEEIDVNPREKNLDLLLAQGPGAKVPVLVTDSGESLCESLIITRYIDECSGGKLMPADIGERVKATELEAIGSLLMDSLFVRSREINARPVEAQSQDVVNLERERAARCYNELESKVSDAGSDVNCGTIAVVAALGYANWRQPGDNWREGRPNLAAYYDRIMERPAFADTAPVF